VFFSLAKYICLGSKQQTAQTEKQAQGKIPCGVFSFKFATSFTNIPLFVIKHGFVTQKDTFSAHKNFITSIGASLEKRRRKTNTLACIILSLVAHLFH